MSQRALQEYTFTSKYARYDELNNRRENWQESVKRVEEMHRTKYPMPELQNDISWAFDQVRQRRVLGSQRALQFGGQPILKKNARLYNCTVSYCDRVRFFQEAFWLLLCGCGTGFSVQKHHVAKLPKFVERSHQTRKFVIEDSIEGWANALGVLMSSYLGDGDFSEFAGLDIEFNFSLIRPEGARLNSSSGKAPGPKPLQNALAKIKTLFERCLTNGQTELRPIDAYDIVMHASDAVLSGGVRRSATICLFSPDDHEMATSKTGNWFNENPQRGRSNNSALLIRNKTTKEQFAELIEHVKQFGEPGFVWSDSPELLVNPCVEIGMWAYQIVNQLKFDKYIAEFGWDQPIWQAAESIGLRSGWQFCNLCEINGKKVKTKEDFRIAAKAAAIIGTLQAGYDKFDYLGETTNNIVKREVLLGVSITGMMDSPDILFDPKLQRQMARLILKVNESIAAKIGINTCARATCVKPAGTTSCILGTASGIHPHHARRYIRRSQANYLEPPLRFFKSINPFAVEKSVWSANGTDEVISFCIEVPKGGKIKNDLDAVTLLNHVKLTQQNWVSVGTNLENCTNPWLKHNVSNTITIRSHEWADVVDFIYANREYFAGISLLPESGDKDYPQAPFTAIYTPKEIVDKYGDGVLMASGLIVDGLRAFHNDLWAACEAVLGITQVEEPDCVDDIINPMQIIDYERKTDWIRRVKQFSERYQGGDDRKTTYLMKDVHNWKFWCDLKREYQDVNYDEMIEYEDTTKLLQESACAGGACQLAYA